MNTSIKTTVESYISEFKAAEELRREKTRAACEEFKARYVAGHASGEFMLDSVNKAVSKAATSFEESCAMLNGKIRKSVADIRAEFCREYGGPAPDPQSVSNCLRFLEAEGREITDESAYAIIHECGCAGHMDTMRRFRRFLECQREYPILTSFSKTFGKLDRYDSILHEFDKLNEDELSRIFSSHLVKTNDIVFVGHNGERAFLDDIVPPRGRELNVMGTNLTELLTHPAAVEHAEKIDDMIQDFAQV